MANWNYTKLTCNNLQKFAEIMKSNPFTWPHTGEAYEDKPVELDSDGIAHIHSRWSVPDKEIEQLSKDNPDLIFIADYSLESGMFDTIYKMEYKNGEGKELGLIPSYSVIYKAGKDPGKYKNIMGDHYQKLYDRAVEIFRRMDIEKQDEKGHKYIDFVTEFTLIIEDEDYRMKISKGFKCGPNCMEIKCLKKIKEVTIKKLELIDLPF